MKINSNKFGKVYALLLLIVFGIEFITPLPKFIWGLMIPIAFLFLLSNYNPKVRVHWIWKLKNRIFKESVE
jgi:hypothetical protein